MNEAGRLGGNVANEGPDFDLCETMRFDPHGGIENLDEHLDKLGRSASENGFPFSRHDARNELQAATFRRKEPALLRLLLSPKGSMAIELSNLND